MDVVAVNAASAAEEKVDVEKKAKTSDAVAAGEWFVAVSF